MNTDFKARSHILPDDLPMIERLGFPATAKRIAAELESLQAQLAEARKDAARWQKVELLAFANTAKPGFQVDKVDPTDSVVRADVAFRYWCDVETLRKHIDSAIQESNK